MASHHGDGNFDPTREQYPPSYGAPQFGAQPYENPQQYGTPAYGTQPYYGQAPGAMPPQYPAPPTAPYGGYPQYPVPVGTNGLAIGSLIASSLGFFYGLPAIVGVVLGILALGQIKRTGQQGRGLAIAGIVVGGVFVVLMLALLVVFLLAIANSH